ncbi:MAG: patatin-like phospholipase family protein [Thermoanaerobaculia bacterium]|nr:patatin-like phospholipase family protein [Thermoanaerobaculia bacterium]
MARGRRASRVALALAGGGPEGAVWEIGALRALDEALEGIDLHAIDIYLGVSAGAFLAANLANGLSTAQMCRAIVKHEPGEHPFNPEVFFTPAVGELLRRGFSVPRLLAEAFAGFAINPRDRSLLDSMTRLSRALPAGVFDNEPIRRYLRTIYTMRGRSDDFRRLRRRLFVVAADLDRGEPVVFGAKGWDHVPISRAIQASAALPGVYPPVDIDGRRFVDGVLLKTMHASVALDAGADLVLCVNPLVPVDVSDRHSALNGEEFDLERRGLPSILSQTFRTLIHSRLTVGMKAYESKYPHADVVLFEPNRDDYEMFFTNIFSFSARRAVAARAYDSTRRDLLARYADLAPVIARHGGRLRLEVLRDPTRELWAGVGLPEDGERGETGRTLRRLDLVLDRAERALGAPPRRARPRAQSSRNSPK